MIDESQYNLSGIKSIIDLLYLPDKQKLIPEPDRSGNIEYKLCLDKKDSDKRDNMVSQMLWRMNEGRNQYGRYEANYILGVHDNGSFSDISEHELVHTTNILRGIAKKANSKVVAEKTYIFPGNKMITHVIIRKDHKERNIPESNVMILGPSGVGKSSLMGKLTYGQRDDGHGFSRKLVLRHIHEKTSGNTSCLKYDTIGFSGDNIINYSIGIEFGTEHVYTASDRLINLIDVPGDIMAFTKTILYSVSSIRPDHIIICIPCKDDEVIDNINPAPVPIIKSISSEYSNNMNSAENEDAEQYVNKWCSSYKFILVLCIVYKIQPIFVFTKYDLLINPNNTHGITRSNFLMKITKLFNTWRDELMNPIQEPILVNLVNLVNNVQEINFQNSPCIAVSNITDHGYSELIDVLSKINIVSNPDKNIIKDKMFIVNDVFTIPDTGIIFHGILRYGVINVDDTVSVLCHGVITKHKIKSIHRKTLDVERLLSGESGSLTFYGKHDKIDKTAVITDLITEQIIDPTTDSIMGPGTESLWGKKIVVKTFVISAFASIKLKPQQYLLFVGNNIVTVILSTCLEKDSLFEINSVNDVGFLLDTHIGILKDERQNYFFVYFV